MAMRVICPPTHPPTLLLTCRDKYISAAGLQFCLRNTGCNLISHTRNEQVELHVDAKDGRFSFTYAVV